MLSPSSGQAAATSSTAGGAAPCRSGCQCSIILAVMPFMAGLKPSCTVLFSPSPLPKCTGWQDVFSLRKAAEPHPWSLDQAQVGCIGSRCKDEEVGHSQGPGNVHKVSQMIPVGLLHDSCQSWPVTVVPDSLHHLRLHRRASLRLPASSRHLLLSIGTCSLLVQPATSNQQSWENPYPEIFGCVRLHHSPKISFQGLHDALHSRACPRLSVLCFSTTAACTQCR